MHAGPMRHRLTIQQDRGTARGADGGHVPDWQDVATVWAEGGPMTVKELWQARQAQVEGTHQFKVRYSAALADLTGSVRGLLRDRVLHLVGVQNVGEWRVALLLLFEEAPDASRFLQDELGAPLLDDDGGLILEP